MDRIILEKYGKCNCTICEYNKGLESISLNCIELKCAPYFQYNISDTKKKIMGVVNEYKRKKRLLRGCAKSINVLMEMYTRSRYAPGNSVYLEAFESFKKHKMIYLNN